MIDLHIQHHFAPHMYAKQMRLPAGHWAQTHQHNFAHMSILANGSVTVNAGGISSDYHAPACIVIAANVVHTITAITDTDWFCIHATDETDIDRINHILIKGD